MFTKRENLAKIKIVLSRSFYRKEEGMDTGLLDEFKIFYSHSVRVMAKKPKVYQALKYALEEVVYGFVEIDDYLDVASEIVQLLKELVFGLEPKNFNLYSFLIGPKKKTIFDDYIKEIDPDIKGEAISFRYVCAELLHRINSFKTVRQERTKLRVVK